MFFLYVDAITKKRPMVYAIGPQKKHLTINWNYDTFGYPSPLPTWL